MTGTSHISHTHITSHIHHTHKVACCNFHSLIVIAYVSLCVYMRVCVCVCHSIDDWDYLTSYVHATLQYIRQQRAIESNALLDVKHNNTTTQQPAQNNAQNTQNNKSVDNNDNKRTQQKPQPQQQVKSDASSDKQNVKGDTRTHTHMRTHTQTHVLQVPST